MALAAAKTSPGRGGAVRSGVLTSLALLVLAGAAIGAGALLAQKFGSTARTDGFLLAYAIYIVLTVAAQAFRFVVVPALTRAEDAGRLGAELRAYTLTFLALGVPVSILVALFAAELGDLVTGRLPPVAATEAAAALPWLVPAGFLQLLAALAASALAARGSYGTAAAGYALGGIAGLAVFAAFADSHGLVSLAWGLVANGIISAGVPFVRLRMIGVRLESGVSLRIGTRLWMLVQGAAVPIATQGLYLIALRLASKLGVGQVSTLSYGYLLAATLVSATAFSLGLISSAPLTRRGLDADAATNHVVHSVWISLCLVGAATGVFALVGDRIVEVVLGSDYKGVGRLVLALTPWMAVMATLHVTLPLAFVLERRRALVPIGACAVALYIPIGLALREAWGRTGIAVGLAIVTLGIVVALMANVSPHMVAPAMRGLLRLVVVLGAAAVAAFALPALVLPNVAAAVVGLALYAAATFFFALRFGGLREAWDYVRALH
jgi:hypothetical protein